MKTIEKQILQNRADDIFKICCFYTLTRIKKYFGSLENYFNSDKPTKSLYLSFGKSLNLTADKDKSFSGIKSGLLQNLSKIQNKKCLKELLPLTGLIYHSKCDVKHKSGKIFSMRSWLEIPPDILRDLWANSKAFKSSSDFYTQRQHKLIDRYILYKGSNMKKKEKEQLKKECDEGKHAFSYDYLVKQIEKKERKAKKTKKTKKTDLPPIQDDIEPLIEDRFQEFIQKKYIGPNEAATLYKGLNPDSLYIPCYNAFGYIPCERNTRHLNSGHTPQQLIAKYVYQQFKNHNIEITDEKTKTAFFKLLKILAA